MTNINKGDIINNIINFKYMKNKTIEDRGKKFMKESNLAEKAIMGGLLQLGDSFNTVRFFVFINLALTLILIFR